MTKLPPQFVKDYSAGMVTNVNDNVVPQNSVKLALNGNFDEELGSFTTRLGTGIVGSQLEAGKNILGLHDFRDSDGSNHVLIAFVNNSGDTNSIGYDVENGSSITGLTTQTASKKHRMLTFLDSVLIINGTDAEKSYDGSTVISTGGAFDLANIPGSNTCDLCIEWLDRVYVAGDTTNPDRLYYSSTPTSGAISWTSGNGYIDIEPEDGGGTITALGKVPGYLLIFKERSLKRWNFDSAFPETLIEQGTPSQESVINAGGVCAFFSASSVDTRGFYITNGGRPIPISHDRARNIKKWVDAIPQSAETNIAGWGTPRYFFWSVGDLTVDGKTYNNVVLRWNRILDQWSVHSYPSEFKVFATFVESGINKIVGGDDNGQVLELNKADTYEDYNGKPIHYKVVHHDEDFGFNQLKTISERIVVNTEGMTGGEVCIETNSNQTRDGQIEGRISELQIRKGLRGNIFNVSVEGTVHGTRGYLRELEYPNVDVDHNYT